jgi:2,3,4,5-tetrahydropyridine-2-carboxylate N-succinyltransferase
LEKSDKSSPLLGKKTMTDRTIPVASPACASDHITTKMATLWQQIQAGETIDIPSAQNWLNEALDHLTDGSMRIIHPPKDSQDSGGWSVNIALKQAILMAFRFFPAKNTDPLPFWWDKIPLLQDQYPRWQQEGIRVVPGAFIRHGVYLGPSCIIMPSFINMGAWIGQGTMIDSGANIGSCAYIGNHCHISANVTIGGVLEPLQAHPVIIEDHVFVGAGCHVVEGVHIRQGSILGSGVILTSSTKVLVRETGAQIHGPIPPYSVLIPGSYTTGNHGLSIQCVILAKTIEPGTHPKTALTQALRT